jgi:hypothetical protein
VKFFWKKWRAQNLFFRPWRYDPYKYFLMRSQLTFDSKIDQVHLDLVKRCLSMSIESRPSIEKILYSVLVQHFGRVIFLCLCCCWTHCLQCCWSYKVGDAPQQRPPGPWGICKCSQMQPWSNNRRFERPTNDFTLRVIFYNNFSGRRCRWHRILLR